MVLPPIHLGGKASASSSRLTCLILPFAAPELGKAKVYDHPYFFVIYVYLRETLLMIFIFFLKEPKVTRLMPDEKIHIALVFSIDYRRFRTVYAGRCVLAEFIRDWFENLHSLSFKAMTLIDAFQFSTLIKKTKRHKRVLLAKSSKAQDPEPTRQSSVIHFDSPYEA